MAERLPVKVLLLLGILVAATLTASCAATSIAEAPPPLVEVEQLETPTTVPTAVAPSPPPTPTPPTAHIAAAEAGDGGITDTAADAVVEWTIDPAADRGPFSGSDTTRCGLLLPVVPPPDGAEPAGTMENVGVAAPPAAALPSLLDVPEAARPAVRRILEAPEDVALVAYELGDEEQGLALNGDAPMPLASVVKVVHLVAYAAAVQAGEINPDSLVLLSDLEQYYLPGSDLRAHEKALADLRAEERIVTAPDGSPAVLLRDLPRMMTEYSSNAATDYLHLLLGQSRIEQTIIDLGLTTATAPCPFLGQFLLMGSGDNALASVAELLGDPELYSRAVMSITVAYSSEPALRPDAAWRNRQQRPALAAQTLFSEHLSAKASAGDYARLMGLIADNQLGPWEQSVRIRRYLEWPTHFTANQEHLAWLGYKGGSLPGVLTVAYYAQPWNRARPIVAVLFFRNLPLDTYRDWRHSLPHDELARWLLYDREALPLLRELTAP
ncbi:MAG: serine hydrolase [Candidatus Promineifilaceae bacterium]|nr:serine hydrolase [Candidatus Promineifilaceae bacterium]